MARRTKVTPIHRTRDSRESTRPEAAGLFRTKNDLPERARQETVSLLNQRLADCIDLKTQAKQAHWNVKGPNFIALHTLFDSVDVEAYADLLAERVVQLGGRADGTARIVAQQTILLDYPLTLTTGEEHVAALSDVLAQFSRSTRIDIEEATELEDAATADILTEITRGIDKWLWMVEAHQQGGRAV